MSEGRRFFFGGPRGLPPGYVAQSPKVVSAQRDAEMVAASGGVVKSVYQPADTDYVVIAREKKVARIMASMLPKGGALYQVETLYEVETEGVEIPGLTVRSLGIRIQRVYDPMVAHDPRAYARLTALVIAPNGIRPPKDLTADRLETFRQAIARIGR